MTLRFPICPMKATIGTLPGDDDRWAFEIKWDGYRTIAFVSDGRVRLQSSSGIDVTDRYPELAHLPSAVNAVSAIVDGELVALDQHGRPSFELLQRHSTQVAFYAFDVLAIDGTDTTAMIYEQRRALLTNLIEPGTNWMVPSHRVGGGVELLEATAAQHLEGVMAKRLGSTYAVGKRSPNWRKVKNRQRVQVVIGGFTAGSGARATTFGALLVGVAERNGTLRFAGGIGTGFDQRLLDQLTTQLTALEIPVCPFDPEPPSAVARTARWVTPTLQATIEIAEFTNDGQVRHGSFVALL